MEWKNASGRWSNVSPNFFSPGFIYSRHSIFLPLAARMKITRKMGGGGGEIYSFFFGEFKNLENIYLEVDNYFIRRKELDISRGSVWPISAVSTCARDATRFYNPTNSKFDRISIRRISFLPPRILYRWENSVVVVVVVVVIRLAELISDRLLRYETRRYLIYIYIHLESRFLKIDTARTYSMRFQNFLSFEITSLLLLLSFPS